MAYFHDVDPVRDVRKLLVRSPGPCVENEGLYVVKKTESNVENSDNTQADGGDKKDPVYFRAFLEPSVRVP